MNDALHPEPANEPAGPEFETEPTPEAKPTAEQPAHPRKPRGPRHPKLPPFGEWATHPPIFHVHHDNDTDAPTERRCGHEHEHGTAPHEHRRPHESMARHGHRRERRMDARILRTARAIHMAERRLGRDHIETTMRHAVSHADYVTTMRTLRALSRAVTHHAGH